MKNLLFTFLFLGCLQTLYSQSLNNLSCTPQQFYSTATIQFETTQLDTISLSLYNNWGVERISYFNDSILSAGSHHLTLYGDSLEQGIYILALTNNTDTLRLVVVKLNETSSIEKNTIDNNFLIFPNPTIDILYINYTLSKNSKTHLVICNSFGQTIKEISSQETLGAYNLAIDTKQFANGIYYVRFSDGINIKQAKVMVH